ncbi:MAG TPA: hypothetical protein VFS08_08215 [Gemmatimonadaceae bacterium]|nr:hypothetical protein [Gemmatimonadaceae bacterium]
MSHVVVYAPMMAAAFPQELKRAALMFEEIRLLVFLSRSVPRFGWHHVEPQARADAEWLERAGLLTIYEVREDIDGPGVAFEVRPSAVPGSGMRFVRDDLPTLPESRTSHDLAHAASLRWQMMARVIALSTHDPERDIAATMLASARMLSQWQVAAGGSLGDDLTLEPRPLSVIVRQMPVPDDRTPWEAILEWRRDEQAQVKYRRFKSWLSNVVMGDDAPEHLDDHLQTLLDDYRAHMHLHRMQVRIAQAESIVLPILEIVRHVFTGRWGEWVRAGFEVQRQQIALLQAELEAPGREIAYVVAAQDRFGRGPG